MQFWSSSHLRKRSILSGRRSASKSETMKTLEVARFLHLIPFVRLGPKSVKQGWPAVVRVLASHQHGPGSNPDVDAKCGLSLLLVLPLAPRGFFSRYSGFPLSSKTNITKFQFDQESGRRRTTVWMCYLQIAIYIIYSFISFIYSCKIENLEPK